MLQFERLLYEDKLRRRLQPLNINTSGIQVEVSQQAYILLGRNLRIKWNTQFDNYKLSIVGSKDQKTIQAKYLQDRLTYMAKLLDPEESADWQSKEVEIGCKYTAPQSKEDERLQSIKLAVQFSRKFCHMGLLYKLSDVNHSLKGFLELAFAKQIELNSIGVSGHIISGKQMYNGAVSQIKGNLNIWLAMSSKLRSGILHMNLIYNNSHGAMLGFYERKLQQHYTILQGFSSDLESYTQVLYQLRENINVTVSVNLKYKASKVSCSLNIN